MKILNVVFAAAFLAGCQDPAVSNKFKLQPGAINLNRFLQHPPTDLLPCTLLQTADLPVEQLGGKLFVQATINRSLATFVFDTGAVQSLITPEAAKRLDLRLVSTNGQTYSGIGGERKASVYRADFVQFGMVHAAAWDFSVADFGLRQGSGIDGLIGADILRAYDVDLDLPASRIRLFYPTHDCSHPSAFLGGALFEVPLQTSFETQSLGNQQIQVIYAPNSPTIAVSVGGKSFNAILDSGAASNVMYRQGFEALGITRADVLSHRSVDMRGIGASAVPASTRKFESAAIGDLEVRNTNFYLIDQEGPIGGAELLLGLPLMNRIHMWISHSSNTLIMQYPPSSSPDAIPVAGGTK